MNTDRDETDPSAQAETLILTYLRSAGPRERHLYVARSNYDGNSAGLRLIADDPGTDRATALMMYWSLGARFLAQYSDDGAVPDWQRDKYTLVRTLESRFLSGFYASGIYFDPSEGPVPPGDYAHLPLRRPIPDAMYAVASGQDWVDLDDPDHDEGLPLTLAHQIWQLFDSTSESAPAPEHPAETHWIEDVRFGRFSLDPAEGAYLEERSTEIGGRRALTSLYIGSYSLAPAELAQRLQALLARLDDFDEHARAALDRALSEMSPRVTGYLDFHLQEVPEILEWLSNCTGHGELLGRASLLQRLGLRGVCFGDLEQSGHITGPMIVSLDYTVGDSHSSRLTDEILCVRLDENGRVLHISHES